MLEFLFCLLIFIYIYIYYYKYFQILNIFLFLFSNKMLVFRAGIHKMLVRIANREDPDQSWNASVTKSIGRRLLTQ